MQSHDARQMELEHTPAALQTHTNTNAQAQTAPTKNEMNSPTSNEKMHDSSSEAILSALCISEPSLVRLLLSLPRWLRRMNQVRLQIKGAHRHIGHGLDKATMASYDELDRNEGSGADANSESSSDLDLDLRSDSTSVIERIDKEINGFVAWHQWTTVMEGAHDAASVQSITRQMRESGAMCQMIDSAGVCLDAFPALLDEMTEEVDVSSTLIHDKVSMLGYLYRKSMESADGFDASPRVSSNHDAVSEKGVMDLFRFVVEKLSVGDCTILWQNANPLAEFHDLIQKMDKYEQLEQSEMPSFIRMLLEKLRGLFEVMHDKILYAHEESTVLQKVINDMNEAECTGTCDNSPYSTEFEGQSRVGKDELEMKHQTDAAKDHLPHEKPKLSIQEKGFCSHEAAIANAKELGSKYNESAATRINFSDQAFHSTPVKKKLFEENLHDLDGASISLQEELHALRSRNMELENQIQSIYSSLGFSSPNAWKRNELFENEVENSYDATTEPSCGHKLEERGGISPKQGLHRVNRILEEIRTLLSTHRENGPVADSETHNGGLDMHKEFQPYASQCHLCDRIRVILDEEYFPTYKDTSHNTTMKHDSEELPLIASDFVMLRNLSKKSNDQGVISEIEYAIQMQMHNQTLANEVSIMRQQLDDYMDLCSKKDEQIAELRKSADSNAYFSSKLQWVIEDSHVDEKMAKSILCANFDRELHIIRSEFFDFHTEFLELRQMKTEYSKLCHQLDEVMTLLTAEMDYRRYLEISIHEVAHIFHSLITQHENETDRRGSLDDLIAKFTHIFGQYTRFSHSIDVLVHAQNESFKLKTLFEKENVHNHIIDSFCKIQEAFLGLHSEGPRSMANPQVREWMANFENTDPYEAIVTILNSMHQLQTDYGRLVQAYNNMEKDIVDLHESVATLQQERDSLRVSVLKRNRAIQTLQKENQSMQAEQAGYKSQMSAVLLDKQQWQASLKNLATENMQLMERLKSLGSDKEHIAANMELRTMRADSYYKQLSHYHTQIHEGIRTLLPMSESASFEGNQSQIVSIHQSLESMELIIQTLSKLTESSLRINGSGLEKKAALDSQIDMNTN